MWILWAIWCSPVEEMTVVPPEDTAAPVDGDGDAS